MSRHVGRLRLLQAQRYSPYAKWLGSALAAVGTTMAALATPTDEMIHFTDWSARLEPIYSDKLAG